MSTLTVSPEYGALLQKVPPEAIRTEKENEAYTEILNELDQRGKTVTPAEKELTELLSAAERALPRLAGALLLALKIHRRSKEKAKTPHARPAHGAPKNFLRDRVRATRLPPSGSLLWVDMLIFRSREDIHGLAHLDAIYPRGFGGRLGLVAANWLCAAGR
jgi:hypothetical protein